MTKSGSNIANKSGGGSETKVGLNKGKPTTSQTSLNTSGSKIGMGKTTTSSRNVNTKPETDRNSAKNITAKPSSNNRPSIGGNKPAGTPRGGTRGGRIPSQTGTKQGQ